MEETRIQSPEIDIAKSSHFDWAVSVHFWRGPSGVLHLERLSRQRQPAWAFNHSKVITFFM